MTRRRLRLRCVSDDDEEEGQSHQQQPGNGNLSVSAPNPSPVPSETVTISDDDFVDVSESFSPPSPSDILPPPLPHLVAPMQFSEGYRSPIGDLLLKMGVKLRGQWLESCIQGLESSIPSFRSLDVEAKAKLCFEQFLFSDMNYSGGGVLPENVDSMHLVDLKGPFVLQVDEIVNISSPLRGRYQDAAPGLKRCLKLCMTDGVQVVYGMEYRPIKDLKVLAPAGLKVAMCNVHIRRGLLMLVPEAIEILGGKVDELEAARQRLVVEVNKPPRGKRTKAGIVPPLATRATLAAWPRDSGNEQTNSTLPRSEDLLRPEQRGANLVPRGSSTTQRTSNEPAVPTIGLNHVLDQSSHVATVVEEMRLGINPVGRESDASNIASVVEEVNLERVSGRETDVYDVTSVVEEMHIDVDPVPVNREYTVSNLSTNSGRIVEDTSMVDEVVHPFKLSGDGEAPFTYLATFSAKWASIKDKVSSINGRIKCFLTGVKGFQYKRRTTYELHCYVDDGSLISDILIHHNVVQRSIGYSPEEVTAALSSLDNQIVSSMKETLKAFQTYLVNFEGTMLVEMNKASSVPVSVEMTQGCSASDAWSLLRRLKPPASVQTPERPPSVPIEISP